MLTRWVFWWCLSPLLSLSDCLSPLPNESRNSHLITAHCTQTFQSCWLIESLSLHQHHKGGRTHEAFKCFCKVSTHWSACWAFEALVSGQCDMMSWIIMRHCWHFVQYSVTFWNQKIAPNFPNNRLTSVHQVSHLFYCFITHILFATSPNRLIWN